MFKNKVRFVTVTDTHTYTHIHTHIHTHTHTHRPTKIPPHHLLPMLYSHYAIHFSAFTPLPSSPVNVSAIFLILIATFTITESGILDAVSAGVRPAPGTAT